MAKFAISNGIFYDTRTGSAQMISDEDANTEYYAIIVQGGHCGNGYYMPCLVPINAKSKELAIVSARNVGKAKSFRKNIILGTIKISQQEFHALKNIAMYNLYLTHNDNNDSMKRILEARIAMPEAIDYKGTGAYGMIPLEMVRTADQYPDRLVLQKYLAPSYYGDKLVYPRNINMRNLLDDYFYYNTIELGLNHQRSAIIGYYYQLYGEDNNLKIKYNNGTLSYPYKGKIITIPVPEFAIPNLEESKAQFAEEAKRKEKEKQAMKRRNKVRRVVKQKSATEKFNERFKRHLEMKKRRENVSVK